MVLRSVKTDRAGARLQGFKIAFASGTPSLSWNNADYSAVTDNGSGDTTLTFSEIFRRVALYFATPTEEVGAGAYAYRGANAAVGSARPLTSTNAGVLTDGGLHGFVYGWDLDMTHSAGWPQRVHVTSIAPRMIPIRLTAPGTMTEGKYQCTVSASTNTSTITFNHPFAVAPTVVAMPDVAGNSVTIVSVSVNQIVLRQTDSAGAATTNGMHILVLGQDLPNKIFKLRRALKCVQLKPRIVAGIITNTAGTYSNTDYADLGTVTKNGTGDITVTFQKAFKRAPVVIASTLISGSVAITSSSTTACRLASSTNAGVATDGTMHVLALGFDYADQL